MMPPLMATQTGMETAMAEMAVAMVTVEMAAMVAEVVMVAVVVVVALCDQNSLKNVAF
jgi:hypothetical protein